jgi:hypothetical protein
MNKLIPLLLLILLTGCVKQIIPPPQAKDLAWCVDTCMEDMFEDMHNNGDSWGTGSSSMNGMQQNNTFLEIKQYCESVYATGCFSVSYSSPLAIHHTPKSFNSAAARNK